MPRLISLIAITGSLLQAAAFGAQEDWSQWRGPNRNGIGHGATIPDWPEGGPKRLWTSEKVASGRDGGFASPVVAGNKVFLYANERYLVPTDKRSIYTLDFRRIGGSDKQIPQAVVDLVENARTGDERKSKRGRSLIPWVEKWVEENITSNSKLRRYQTFAKRRLRDGEKALPMDIMRKLTSVVGKEFESQAALDVWLKTLNVPNEDWMDQIQDLFPATRDEATDRIFAFDTETGKTVWKAEIPGTKVNASSTLCVADGRVFGQLSQGNFVCLNADDGKVIWKCPKARNPMHPSLLPRVG